MWTIVCVFVCLTDISIRSAQALIEQQRAKHLVDEIRIESYEWEASSRVCAILFLLHQFTQRAHVSKTNHKKSFLRRLVKTRWGIGRLHKHEEKCFPIPCQAQCTCKYMRERVSWAGGFYVGKHKVSSPHPLHYSCHSILRYKSSINIASHKL